MGKHTVSVVVGVRLIKIHSSHFLIFPFEDGNCN